MPPSTLGWLRTNGYEDLLARTTIALVANTFSPDTAAARDLLATAGLPMTIVPLDHHLATGTTINPGHLAEAIHAAITKIAVESFSQAQTGGAP